MVLALYLACSLVVLGSMIYLGICVNEFEKKARALHAAMVKRYAMEEDE